MKSLTKFCPSFLSLLIILFASSAVAVDDIEKFEMDGDAFKDGPTAPVYPGDDWNSLMNGGPYYLGVPPLVFTGIKHDHDPDDVFDGGKKDIQDISQWTWKYATPLDKGNITHAYATAYMCPAGGFPSDCKGDACECRDGDVVTYFGADRASNKGDTFMGFWFFKQDVKAVNGGFTNHHENGDALVLVNFPQASNAEPEIKVVKWEDSCSKGVKNPAIGECAAKHLELVYNGVVCHSALSDDACAITNTEVLFPNTSIPLAPGTVMAPWDYISKNPDANCPGAAYCFPYETFFEGGINLTKLLAATGDTCFASFMTETRSSSEFTATLKDFSLDQFPLCALELSKVCGTGVYLPNKGYIEIPYSITVENTGSATVSTVNATDDVCGTGSAEFIFNDVLVGTPQTQGGFCQFLPGSFTPPIENGVKATASDGTAVVLADLPGCTKDDGAPEWCFDGCEFDLSPDIAVTKECDTRLTAENGTVEVKVLFNGVVSNTSPVSAPTLLENVEVWDDNGTPSDINDDVLLTLLDNPAKVIF